MLDSFNQIQVGPGTPSPLPSYTHTPPLPALSPGAALSRRMLCAAQNECQVSLNTVDSIETFVSDINNGRWEVVLPQVAALKLPRSKLENLYEQARVAFRPHVRYSCAPSALSCAVGQM